MLGVLVLAAVLMASPAQGVLLERDLVAGCGDGLLTFDTHTRLLWLDLTETTGLSFDEVTIELGSGGAYEGFRYADNSEIVALWLTAGLVDIDLPGFLNFTEENYLPAADLIDLIGATQISGAGGGQVVARGISATPIPNQPQNRFTPQLELSEFALPYTAEARTNGIINVGHGVSITGSWLVLPISRAGQVLPRRNRSRCP